MKETCLGISGVLTLTCALTLPLSVAQPSYPHLHLTIAKVRTPLLKTGLSAALTSPTM